VLEFLECDTWIRAGRSAVEKEVAVAEEGGVVAGRSNATDGRLLFGVLPHGLLPSLVFVVSGDKIALTGDVLSPCLVLVVSLLLLFPLLLLLVAREGNEKRMSSV